MDFILVLHQHSGSRDRARWTERGFEQQTTLWTILSLRVDWFGALGVVALAAHVLHANKLQIEDQ